VNEYMYSIYRSENDLYYTVEYLHEITLNILIAIIIEFIEEISILILR